MRAFSVVSLKVIVKKIIKKYTRKHKEIPA